MKSQTLIISTMLFLAWNSATAQGTAFTYQGRLMDGTNPAAGSYDLRFTTYDSPSSDNVSGEPITNSLVDVTQGLFTTTLDFGTNVFLGNDIWLEIGVRIHGSADPFVTLSPRQPILPTPYAIHAGSVNADAINGTISGSQISDGTIRSNSLAPGAAAANLASDGHGVVPGGALLLSNSPNATNLLTSGYKRIGGQIDMSWQEREGNSPRSGHVAVWTETEMIVWGGQDSGYLRNDGARFEPAANRWNKITLSGAPTARLWHSAVWTGEEMIVWGGTEDRTGGRYNPSTDTWVPTPNSVAPSARSGQTAVWTGNRMIVWGGSWASQWFNNGGLYNPTANSWSSVSTEGAPNARIYHTAVWTGTEMIIWGGVYITGFSPSYSYTHFNDGGRYNPTSNTWRPISTNGVPIGRYFHSAVWTGNEMIIWGGTTNNPNGDGHLNNGASYNPITDTWHPITDNGAPELKSAHTAVWADGEMIIWGGEDVNTGSRYNLVTDRWAPMSTSSGPGPRSSHTSIWTGTEMIVFGGRRANVGSFGDTFSYSPTRLMYLYLKP